MSDTLGKLPLPAEVRTWDVPHEGCTITYQQALFTTEQMRTYAAEQVAAARVSLTDEQIEAAWKAWPRTAITSAPRAIEFVRSIKLHNQAHAGDKQKESR